MKTERHCGEEIRFPEWADFIEYRPIFRDLEGLPDVRELFELIIDPLVFFEARAYSKAETPAILAIGDICLGWAKKHHKNWASCNRERQLCGSAMCLFLESNALMKKTGPKGDVKRNVPHPAFSRAQVYELVLRPSH